jgi:nucleotide-binding universal stress UspA family protein
MNIRRAVIAVDFTPASVVMARWVLDSFGPGVEPVFVHVVKADPGDGSPRVSATIETECLGAETRIRDLADALGVEEQRWVVRVGDAAEIIADAALTWGAQLVVVGPHEHRGKSWGDSDTVEEIMAKVRLPVLIVQSPRASPPSNALVALEAVSIIPHNFGVWMQWLYSRMHTRFHLLHGVTPSIPVDALVPIQLGAGDVPDILPATELQDGYRDTLSALGIPVDAVSVESSWGSPGEEILSAAERANCDLILIGQSRHGRLSRALLGSITRSVAHSADRPVLVIPEDEPGS